MKIKRYKDKRGKWRWRITGRNREIVAASSQGFSTNQKCGGNLKLTAKALNFPTHGETKLLEQYPLPWSFDSVRPTSAAVYAKDSTRVCSIVGEGAEERARLIVALANTNEVHP